MIVQPHCAETHYFSAANDDYRLIRHFVPRMGMLAFNCKFLIVVSAKQGHSSLYLHFSRHVIITTGWKMQQASPG